MEMTVKVEPDTEGYVGRECPDCKKYFKIKTGTGLPGAPPCHCPYCNHTAATNEFFTEDQVEYAKSVFLNKFTGDFLASLKLERRPDPRAFISIGITVKGSRTPIVRYSEKELEERALSGHKRTMRRTRDQSRLSVPKVGPCEAEMRSGKRRK